MSAPSLKSRLEVAYVWLSGLRLILHVLVFLSSAKKSIIEADLRRWHSIYNPTRSSFSSVRALLWFLTLYPEYRNLFYYRTGLIGKLLQPLCKPMPTLHIATPKIGSGFFIQHGFATIIAAERIGENCWINQQVTIGYSNATDRPTLGDNVTVNAGAKIIGKVIVGQDTVVGANAVVVRDLPAGATAVGVPARIVKLYGKRHQDADTRSSHECT